MATILILGGYGMAGQPMVRHLLAQTDAKIIIAGRSLDKAQRMVDSFKDSRLSARQADASDLASLRAALQGVEICLVFSTTTHHTATVIQACLAEKVDYLDIQFAKRKLQALFAAQEQIREAGLCFVTEAGYHPGLPAAMVKYAASHMDSLETAVTSAILAWAGRPHSHTPMRSTS